MVARRIGPEQLWLGQALTPPGDGDASKRLTADLTDESTISSRRQRFSFAAQTEHCNSGARCLLVSYRTLVWKPKPEAVD